MVLVSPLNPPTLGDFSVWRREAKPPFEHLTPDYETNYEVNYYIFYLISALSFKSEFLDLCKVRFFQDAEGIIDPFVWIEAARHKRPQLLI